MQDEPTQFLFAHSTDQPLGSFHTSVSIWTRYRIWAPACLRSSSYPPFVRIRCTARFVLPCTREGERNFDKNFMSTVYNAYRSFPSFPLFFSEYRLFLIPLRDCIAHTANYFSLGMQPFDISPHNSYKITIYTLIRQPALHHRALYLSLSWLSIILFLCIFLHD